MFAALVVPNYRIWMAGAFVSNIGTWMQRVAQDWFVLELSGGSGVAVGITTALQFLPMLLLSPVGAQLTGSARRAVLVAAAVYVPLAVVVGASVGAGLGHVASTLGSRLRQR